MIGLLRDDKHDGLDQDAKPSVFLPYPTAMRPADRNDLRSLRLMSIILRGSGDWDSRRRPAHGPCRC